MSKKHKNKLDYDQMLRDYGVDGLYQISKELLIIADEETRKAIKKDCDGTDGWRVEDNEYSSKNNI